MASSDYIVAALPATPATEKFVNADAISAMQSHAVFINLGRGTTVDEAALTEGMEDLPSFLLTRTGVTTKPGCSIHQVSSDGLNY